LAVKYLDHSDKSRWDDYVLRHEDSTPFHLTKWSDAVESGFRQKAYLLYVEDGGEVAGVLPLIHVSSLFFKPALISCGFSVYGGPLANDPAAHEALDAEARDLARRLGVDVIEYRSQHVIRPHWVHKSDIYATFKKAINPDSEVNMKAIPRKQRAMVRKAMGFDLTYDIQHQGDDHFYLYSTSLRNLGTPAFPRRFFEALLTGFGDDCDILTVRHEGRAISSVLSFYFKDEVLPYYGGGSADARTYAANDFMYWSLMEHAREKGCTSFDFGRSKIGTGAFSFKKNWGFEPQNLHYEYDLLDGAEMPDVNPMNPKYQLMVSCWQKLPLFLANAMGPMISRGLG